MNKQNMIHLFMKELLMYNDPILVNFSQYVTNPEYTRSIVATYMDLTCFQTTWQVIPDFASNKCTWYFLYYLS